ncbi:dyslexia-associated protein KIAA0319-like protein [Cephus cinctus]|uniref:Dyslexia-associated protein KIAA0319-like protein n=1 Tax=Cephus cinctus TaxID=211228 RepID=A0AAJ7W3M7_CEPCN|nr:dyslexia-associated protein KIAA0319-like protein [Cephus cinctus]XP_015600422.1 dyslexia-associated protein KIAA0319-like protein [Cephus cinctus]XP_015600424.1 dyslexia-associated protein KIAA0319-like protein [Cephus cinctus]XP_024943366.1 dyslexia-associated protein KIAA0319-like protein [Cephus cinctus]XP_024943367.1 dyslexia-associated protein KIAA0319-like protein [Cephus cinctus]XP_024943368.1 dyslexia-associated protein KIAA0319-like protein [Cephus cinctus]XP_024943369.1 dyslexia
MGKLNLGTVLLLLFQACLADYADYNDEWQLRCPGLYQRVFTSYTPQGNLTFGVIIKSTSYTSMKNCVVTCCKENSCNVALMHNDTCYHVQCRSNKLCVPLYRPDLANDNPPSMVLVKPLRESDLWSDYLEGINDDTDSLILENTATSHVLFNSNEMSCMDGVQDCPENEVCITHGDKAGEGVCQCSIRFKRNSAGVCIAMDDLENSEASDTPDILKVQVPKNNSTSVKPPVKQLLVSAVSKQVRLPENEVTLSAYTVPGEQENEHYNYVWSLLSQPEGETGTMTDQNKMTVKLSHLSEGTYNFKVAVSSPTAYGEAYANVTVLPPKRINQAPIAIISPASQIVKLPNTGAVLDGSSSKDDDQVISYHWELEQGPIGYQPNLVATPTLQLDNLIAGNYTFKLTVEDSDHVTNYTTANITVLKVIDYPPSANAGQNIIIYLPQNTLTLNGNLSTDDRGIDSWEWTKSPSDQNKAVDMQNTRTPYLQLSNLEAGMYTFVLKVTDDSNQSSTSEVHVFVKPPTNKPPEADAGDNITIALPETKVTLDGSRSKDDIKIVSYLWEQISGPNKAELNTANESITNVTKLTKGDYIFKLTVIDDNGNKNSSNVEVKVTQNKNAPPKANAGGDQVVIAPVNALIINGSQSSDDLGIVNWLWTRDSSSLAIGNIIEGTDKSPVLMLTDIVPGRFVFRLKVTDDQGLSNEDTVSVIVKPDPKLLHLIELTLNIETHLLTKSQEDSLVVKLQMLLREEATIVVRTLRAEPRTGRVVLVFYVDKKGGKSSMPGPEVVQRLKQKLRQDSGLLQLSVINVETVVCQNNCSGHGVCDQETRQCLCEAFWMQNFIQKYFGNSESNCDWSILYVIIALLSLIVCWVGCVWGLVCLCQRICGRKRHSLRPKKKPARYSLLQPDLEDDSFTSHKKMVLSESDTDSDDVLFEHRKGKSNGHLRNGKSRNGFLKAGSRVKT